MARKVIKGARGAYVDEGYVDLETEVVLDEEGRRIDQAYVDRLVKAADAVRPAGRPSLSGKAGASPQIAVRLPVETYQRAAEVARERGVTLAALTREAVEAFLRAS